MPHVLMEHIMQHLDFLSILVLRKTCHYLRNLIDDSKPASRLTEIGVVANPSSIDFDLCFPGSPISIHYLKNGEGCLVTCKKEENVKETMMDDEDFVTVFFNDFDIVLRHQKTLLEDFRFLFNSPNSIVKEIVMESVSKSLKAMNQPLHVKSLHMGVSNHEEVLTILPYMDPKPLELINIFHISGRDKVALNLSEIGQLEQWKQANELLIHRFQITDLVRNLQHFSRIVFGNREVSIEELFLLKEIFLSSSTSTTFKIFCNPNCSAVVRQGLIETFGQPFLDNSRDENWFFRIPDNNQFLRITFKHCCIHFNRIEQSDVPQNAAISN